MEDPNFRQCTARSKQSGVRCKRRASPGHQVCVIHGSRSPQAMAKARERLDAMAGSAVTTLDLAMDKIDTEPSVAVKAAVAVLDRTGYHPRQTIEIDNARKVLSEFLGVDETEIPE